MGWVPPTTSGCPEPNPRPQAPPQTGYPQPPPPSPSWGSYILVGTDPLPARCQPLCHQRLGDVLTTRVCKEKRGEQSACKERCLSSLERIHEWVDHEEMRCVSAVQALHPLLWSTCPPQHGDFSSRGVGTCVTPPQCPTGSSLSLPISLETTKRAMQTLQAHPTEPDSCAIPKHDPTAMQDEGKALTLLTQSLGAVGMLCPLTKAGAEASPH